MITSLVNTEQSSFLNFYRSGRSCLLVNIYIYILHISSQVFSDLNHFLENNGRL